MYRCCSQGAVVRVCVYLSSSTLNLNRALKSSWFAEYTAMRQIRQSDLNGALLTLILWYCHYEQL